MAVESVDRALPPDANGNEADKVEEIYAASQWQLMWWRFRKHKLAMVSAALIALLYAMAIFCEFLAPYVPTSKVAKFKDAPPQLLRFVDAEGNFHPRPFVYGLTRERDPETMRWIYQDDTSKIFPIRFLVHGEQYKMWGRFEGDLHLFGINAGDDDMATISLMGRDGLGQDVLSRVIYGARISMSIGLVGVVLSLTLGILLGGISGYYGGTMDVVIQRVIEFLRSVPTIPLWMGLAAAVPVRWPPERVYFGITIILSLIGWTTMARQVRGRFLSLREADFVIAARLDGCSELRVIVRHMVPSFLSHIIATMTLAVPTMILSETSLSFLGLGLRPPIISWGVLLKEAQSVQTVALSPWLLLPGLFVVVAVLAFNFVGDGLRDAADPYGRAS